MTSALLTSLAVCLAAQAESRPLDPDAAFDVSKVDAAPEAARDAKPELGPVYEAVTARPVTYTRVLELERGAGALVEVELRLHRAPSGPVALRLQTRGRPKLEIGPPLGAARAERASGPPPAAPVAKKRRGKRPPKETRAPGGESWLARGRYFVRGLRETPELVRANAVLEVIELESGQSLGRLEVEHELRTIAPSGAPELVRQLEAAARHFEDARAEAERALRQAAGSVVPLSPEALQPGRLSASSLALLVAALEASWRRAVALERLRALAHGAEEPTIEAAVLALGRLSPRVEASREPSRGEIGAELDELSRHLASLDFERAERGLAGLRRRADLSRAEFARLLGLDGALAAARGQVEAAERAFGQALCLEPALKSPDSRSPMRRIFERVKAEAPCATALHAEAPEAFLASPAGETELHVRLKLGPDPYGVVAGGTVLLYGGGGGVLAERNVRAEGDGTRVLLAAFPDDEDFRNMAGELLVQVVAKSVSGVSLVAVGDPVPIRLVVGEHEDYSAGVPWWIWLGGGILILAGAGVATALLVPREEVRGIGPIDVTF